MIHPVARVFMLFRESDSPSTGTGFKIENLNVALTAVDVVANVSPDLL